MTKNTLAYYNSQLVDTSDRYQFNICYRGQRVSLQGGFGSFVITTQALTLLASKGALSVFLASYPTSSYPLLLFLTTSQTKSESLTPLPSLVTSKTNRGTLLRGTSEMVCPPCSTSKQSPFDHAAVCA